jgi:Fe-S-cluster containining protein
MTPAATAWRSALRAILRDAEEALERFAPSCQACGFCCDFQRAGHRLYVTPAELELLAEQPPPGAPEPMRCPYQVAGTCTARDRRPLGCRVYFCRGLPPVDQQAFYERFHHALVELHRRHGLEYCYEELTTALHTGRTPD